MNAFMRDFTKINADSIESNKIPSDSNKSSAESKSDFAIANDSVIERGEASWQSMESQNGNPDSVIARFCVAESWQSIKKNAIIANHFKAMLYQSKIHNKTKWIASASPRKDERRDAVIARQAEGLALRQQLTQTCKSKKSQLIYTCKSA